MLVRLVVDQLPAYGIVYCVCYSQTVFSAMVFSHHRHILLTVAAVGFCCWFLLLLARFELLCRIRIAHNFGTLAGRRQLVKQRLLAFNVLLQCSPTAGGLTAQQLCPQFAVVAALANCCVRLSAATEADAFLGSGYDVLSHLCACACPIVQECTLRSAGSMQPLCCVLCLLCMGGGH
jgi:hypothetical protein